MFKDMLNSALSKLAPYQGEVKRGAQLPQALLEEHSDGSVVTYGAFTSTSLSDGFTYGQRFVIRSKTGRYIGPFSKAFSENEVLFPADTKFKFIKHEVRKGTTYIVMDEVE